MFCCNVNAHHLCSQVERLSCACSSQDSPCPSMAPAPPSQPSAICLPQLQPASAWQPTAVAAPVGDSPQPVAALPLQPTKPPPPVSLLPSGTSGGSAAAMHYVKGHGLPPIQGQGMQTSWSPNKGQKAALSKAGKKGAGVTLGKQQGQLQAASQVPHGNRADKGSPGWNSDFTIQYRDPLSIKDQERALRHAGQGRLRQPCASAVSREHQGAAKIRSPSRSPGTPLSSFTSQPAGMQDSMPQQPPSAAAHCTTAAGQLQSVARMGSALAMPGELGKSKGKLSSNRLRGGSIAYSRNLDSAQSPLRPAKGVIADDTAGLCKLNKFCFLPFQVCCQAAMYVVGRKMSLQ